VSASSVSRSVKSSCLFLHISTAFTVVRFRSARRRLCFDSWYSLPCCLCNFIALLRESRVVATSRLPKINIKAQGTSFTSTAWVQKFKVTTVAATSGGNCAPTIRQVELISADSIKSYVETVELPAWKKQLLVKRCVVSKETQSFVNRQFKLAMSV
jgi:hypothetical protein